MCKTFNEPDTMEQDAIILTTPAQLQRIVEAAVNNVIPKLNEYYRNRKEAPETDNLSVVDTVKFITAQGIPMTRATLYNLVYKNEIPHRKFGRRSIFSKRELSTWIESRIRRPEDKQAAAALRIAESANRKG